MRNVLRDYFSLARSIEQAKREGRSDELQLAANENARIQEIMMRPMKRETVNGSGEIGWGTALLCFALSSDATVVLPNSPWRSAISWSFLLGACLAMPLSRWAIQRYVTWPRTGYATLRRDKHVRTALVITVLVSAAVAIAISTMMALEVTHVASHPGTGGPQTLSLASNLILIGMGPLNAILYLMLNAVSIKEHRWKWLLFAVIALAPLGICYLVPGNFIEMWRPAMLFLGIVNLISGLITLVSFIRRTQPIAPGTE